MPGRRLGDNVHVLLCWQNGVTGTLIAIQTSLDHSNDPSLRVCGDKARLEWSGLQPEILRHSVYGEQTRTLTRGGHGAFGAAQRASRMPAAHPEGEIEAFATIYRDAADLIRAHRGGSALPKGRAGPVPRAIDGARASSKCWPNTRHRSAERGECRLG